MVAACLDVKKPWELLEEDLELGVTTESLQVGSLENCHFQVPGSQW